MLSPAFMNTDIARLRYNHAKMESMVVQKMRCKGYLSGFPKGEEVDKICSTLQSLEMLFSHSVKIGCDITISKQVSVGD